MSSIRKVFGAAMLVSGTVIGAGMLALPTSMAGIGFSAALWILALTWLAMLLAGWFILELGTYCPPGANFPTMIGLTLGKFWNSINNIALGFVMFILCYAYITSGGDLITSSIATVSQQQLTLPLSVGQILFFAAVMPLVWFSGHWLSRVNTVLMIALLLSFFMAGAQLAFNAEPQFLFPVDVAEQGQWRFFWATLPVAMMSFGFQIIVPVVYQQLQSDVKKSAWAIMLGLLLPLIIYVFWMVAVMGHLPRSGFLPVIAEDGKLSVLLNALSQNANQAIDFLLLAFTYFAVGTSLLGVSVSLFDFVRDLFGFGTTQIERLKTMLVSFLPPLFFSLMNPTGFITSISYVGLTMTLWCAIIPALAVWRVRKTRAPSAFKTAGGSVAVWFVIAFGVVNMIAMLATRAGWLPVYGQ